MNCREWAKRIVLRPNQKHSAAFMKTLKITFLAFAGLFSSLASATDLYVRDLGAGGAFSTIGAAIAQASDGDRIIIRPKAGSVPYVENLTINKSLSFVSEINYAKYILQGTVSVTAAAGRTVTINNLQVSGTGAISIDAATVGGRTTLNILNSTIAAVNAGQSNATLNLSGCTGTAVVMTHGRCTGNKVDSILFSNQGTDSHLSDDDIEIIANAILTTGGLGGNQRNYAVRLFNNYLANGVIYINGAKTDSTNEIANNVIGSTTNTNIQPLYSITLNLAAGNQALYSIVNNVILKQSSSYATYYPVIASANASAYVYYNITNASEYNGSFIMPSVTNSGNNAAATLSLNGTTFTVTGTSGIINGGSPEDDYADTDLSRNDRGNAGGSNAWSNYWPANVGNKPQVNYLKTPRRVYAGTQEMNAQGAGHSK